MSVYPLRSITFVAELVYPQAAHNLQKLQKIHDRAFENPATRYANFQVFPGGVQLSNPSRVAGAASIASVLPDRLRVQEQSTGISHEDFQQRVRGLAELVLSQLSIPNFLAEQFLIQSLVNSKSTDHTMEFMRDSVLAFEEASWEAFDQEPNLLGIRLRFPVEDDPHSLFHVRVENYHKDPRSLFVENVGLFRHLVQQDNLDELAARFGQTYDYLKGPVVQFISQFDSRREL